MHLDIYLYFIINLKDNCTKSFNKVMIIVLINQFFIIYLF